MPYLLNPFKVLQVLPLLVGLTSAVADGEYGLRCTRPYCDFECMRKDRTNLRDIGAEDIDEDMVRLPPRLQPRITTIP